MQKSPLIVYFAGQEQFSYKFRDFATSVVYHPTLPGVFLCGTSSNGIFAIDSKAGRVILLGLYIFSMIIVFCNSDFNIRIKYKNNSCCNVTI